MISHRLDIDDIPDTVTTNIVNKSINQQDDAIYENIRKQQTVAYNRLADVLLLGVDLTVLQQEVYELETYIRTMLQGFTAKEAQGYYNDNWIKI